MNIISDIKAKFNPKSIYNLRFGKIDKYIIDVAINKNLSLEEDSYGVLRTNPMFLKSYFERVDINKIKDEYHNIPIDSLSKQDREEIFKIVQNRSTDLFLYLLRRDNLLEDFDFTNFKFNDDELIKLIELIEIMNYRRSIKNISFIKNNPNIINVLNKTNPTFTQTYYKDILEIFPNRKEEILEKLIDLLNNSKNVYFNTDLLANLISESSRKEEYIQVLIKIGNYARISLATKEDYYKYFKENIDNLDPRSESSFRNMSRENQLEIFDLYINNNKINPKIFGSMFYNLSLYYTDKDKLVQIVENYVINGDLDFDDYQNFIISNDVVGFIKKDISYLDKVIKLLYSGKEINKLIPIVKENIGYISNETLNNFINKVLFSDESIDEALNYELISRDYDFLENKINIMSEDTRRKLYNYTTNMNVKRRIDAFKNTGIFDINEESVGSYFYKVTDYNREQVVNVLKKIKDQGKIDSVVLIMERIDKDFLKVCEEILPNKIRVAPLANQVNSDKIVDPLSYEIKEILEKDRTLDLYVDSIMHSYDLEHNLKELSPFEKYCAVYRIVTHFAKYNLGDDIDYRESRSVYNFINNSDPRICCQGYTLLMIELLDRIGGFKTCDWGCVCDEYSSKNEESKENKEHTTDSHCDNHSRLMIRITDPKYGIDGIYMADPTWDSIRDKDLANITAKSKHLLMSRSEAETIDGKIFYNARCLRYYKKHELMKIDPSLTEEEVMGLIDKPISVETKAKALVIVDHFVDRTKKIPKLEEIDKGEIIYKELQEKMIENKELSSDELDSLFNYLYKNKTFNEILEDKFIIEDLFEYVKSNLGKILYNNGIHINNGEINLSIKVNNNEKDIIKLINSTFKNVAFYVDGNNIDIAFRLYDNINLDNILEEEFVKLISNINNFNRKISIINIEENEEFKRTM